MKIHLFLVCHYPFAMSRGNKKRARQQRHQRQQQLDCDMLGCVSDFLELNDLTRVGSVATQWAKVLRAAIQRHASRLCAAWALFMPVLETQVPDKLRMQPLFRLLVDRSTGAWRPSALLSIALINRSRAYESPPEPASSRRPRAALINPPACPLALAIFSQSVQWEPDIIWCPLVDHPGRARCRVAVSFVLAAVHENLVARLDAMGVSCKSQVAGMFARAARNDLFCAEYGPAGHDADFIKLIASVEDDFKETNRVTRELVQPLLQLYPVPMARLLHFLDGIEFRGRQPANQTPQAFHIAWSGEYQPHPCH